MMNGIQYLANMNKQLDLDKWMSGNSLDLMKLLSDLNISLEDPMDQTFMNLLCGNKTWIVMSKEPEVKGGPNSFITSKGLTELDLYMNESDINPDLHSRTYLEGRGDAYIGKDGKVTHLCDEDGEWWSLSYPDAEKFDVVIVI